MFLHLDLDCFFASAHRIDNTKYDNIPIAVGGRSNLNIFNKIKQKRVMSNIEGAFTSSILTSNENKTFEEYFKDPDGRLRGIITTSSYEARSYGVKTAMSVSEAIRLCPTLTILPPNYPLYHELSYKLKILLEKEIPHVQQGSIDEFYGNVDGWIKEEDILEFCFNLKQKIKDDLGLPISIGIAHTKYIAKLATNHAKPFGIKYVPRQEREEFIKNMPISNFPGIGKNYEQRLFKYGIKKLGDIKNNKELFYSWKKPGIELYNRICGIDNDKIEIIDDKKSIGLGRTFDAFEDRIEIKRRINILCRHLSFIAIKNNYKPLTYSLKIRYEYGKSNKDYVNSHRMFNESVFKQMTIEIFNKIDIHPTHKIVQLNITLSNFSSQKQTTFDMFNLENDLKEENLSKSMHKLRDKFGIDIIKSANEM